MSEVPYQRWVCDACGYIYDEAKGDPDSGLVAGTRFVDIPEDWSCPLCGLTKSDLRLLPDAPVATPKRKASLNVNGKSKGGKDYVVIVGAGIAGWSAAESIRQRDSDINILLVSACKGAVYPKPAISMALSQGKQAADLIDMDAIAKAETLGIEVRTETRIIRIDTARKRLTTVKGGIEYGKLVLAMGASQRELPISGTAAEQVLRVNDLKSYQMLYERLQTGRQHITMLGAGLIGCEFADDLTKAGHTVTLVDPQTQALSRLLPDVMSETLQGKLHEKGVEWRLGQTLTRLDQQGGHLQAHLSDHSEFATDLVIAAAGLLPNTKLAEKAGLAINRGIVVNHDMQTTDPAIYAVGDCAEVDGQVFAYIEPIRRQSAALAASVVGGHEPFMLHAPLIKVKTPTLPISLCSATPSPEGDHWAAVSGDNDGVYFEARDGEQWLGFAMSGDKAAEAGEVYRSFLASS